MNEQLHVDVRTEPGGDRARLVPAGPFDLPHATAVASALGKPVGLWEHAARSMSI